MSVNELRQAADTLRGFEDGDTIHVSRELANALAGVLDMAAVTGESIAFIAAQPVDECVSHGHLTIARLINGGLA